MDFITKSSGLHHILENVFMELDQEHLKICEKVHPIWRHLVLNKSLKWYSKKLIQNCHNLTKKDKSDWMELINKLICNCNPQQKTYMKQFFYDFSYRIDKFSSVSEEIFAAIENGMDDFIQIIAPYIENLAAKHYSSKCWIPTPFHHATRRAIETMDLCLFRNHAFLRIVKILAPLTDKLETPFTKRSYNSVCKFDGLTPLQAAVRDGSSEIVKILMPLTNTRSNVDISINGTTTTLINIAAALGHADVIRELLPFIEEPNTLGNFSIPIHIAIRCGYSEVIRVLLPFSNDPNAPDSNGFTPIQRAVQLGHGFVDENLEVVRLLIPYSDNPNAPNPSRWTPIQMAAKNGLSNIFKLLAPITKNINAPCPDGLTPLELASKHGHTVIEELLIQILSKNDSVSMGNIVEEDAEKIMKETNFDDEVDEEDDSEDMWECGYCHETFQTESSLDEHVENDHI